jgi:hypothetical protein
VMFDAAGGKEITAMTSIAMASKDACFVAIAGFNNGY